MITFHIITIFPEIFNSYFQESILARAQDAKKIKIKIYNLRDFTNDKHRKVDSRPYGGGPGMVLQAEPILKAIKKAKGRKKDVKIILFSPSGKKFNNKTARDFSKKFKDVILICGRYEGVDARVKKIYRAQEISIGDYVLTGGELPAMVFVDATTRQIKGVLGKEESLEENRIASSEIYTRPDEVKFDGKKYKVPKVLLSGNHKKIEEWRAKKDKKVIK